MTHQKKRGFTLVEILVVLTIIMILMAIMLPSMARVREVTRYTICQSNLRQQGMGLISYAIETKYYPGCHGRTEKGTIVGAWVTRTRTWGGLERGVYYCPTQPEGFEWQEKFGTGNAYATEKDVKDWGYEKGEFLLNVNTVPFSYGYNDWGAYNVQTNPHRGLGGDLNFGFAMGEYRFSLVVSPANMIAIGDNVSTGKWDFNMDPKQWWEYPAKAHFGGPNLVMADGHVEWQKQEDVILSAYSPNLWTERDKEIARMWNNNHDWK
ncbi:MAG: prepilin-type N-terminal cleavage/methylation domain-containing protein [Phycisphaera sp.]|nr:prepilin-type N-terminal cleavage/methylation domain-containing protein [Phycisphaera sp.]